MLVDTNVQAKMAWNTWSNRPAEMVFLPLGVRLTPVLFSNRLAKATTIRPGADLVLGRHGMDGEIVEFETRHGGSRLAFTYEKTDPYAVRGRWETLELQEWGLRYWVSLCLSAENGATVDHDAATGAAVVKVGTRFVALVTAGQPVQVTAHDDVAGLVADFDAHGYFHLASRGTSAPALALRFELEMSRSGQFAAAVADSRDLAISKARACLEADGDAPALSVQTGRHAGSLDAVRDLMAWNTIHDATNHRRFTATSRMWDLGGFAVWYNDQTYAALMSGLFDRQAGFGNMAVAMSNATPQGNFACIVNTNDSWVDRTQAPNGAFMAWMMFLRSRDRALLELVYEPLARNQRWWRSHRDPDGRGLVSCGTSDVGEGMYKGMHFGARNETGMDNSATHDEAVYEPDTRTLSTFDVGLNATLALDAEMLALIAAELGHAEEAAEFADLAASSRQKISDELYDETRGIFANRQRSGAFVKSLGPTSFYPLICGAATKEQAASLLKHLDDPATFGGEYVIPNATRDDPAFGDNVYWRGRIWPNVNYFVWHALRRYGFETEATAFAQKCLKLFDQSWNDRRIAAENYSAVTGDATDQPDTDPFYSWAGMLPLLGVAEVMDFNPWGGWEIQNTGAPVTLGPIETPAGAVTLDVADGRLEVRRADGLLFATDFVGRLSHITATDTLFSCRLHPAAPGKAATLDLPVAESAVIAVRLDGIGVSASARNGGISIALGDAGRLDVYLTA